MHLAEGVARHGVESQHVADRELVIGGDELVAHVAGARADDEALGETLADPGVEDSPSAPVATALAPSKSDSAAARTWRISESGKATFVMEGKIETIQGDVTKARGTLEIDPNHGGAKRALESLHGQDP